MKHYADRFRLPFTLDVGDKAYIRLNHGYKLPGVLAPKLGPQDFRGLSNVEWTSDIYQAPEAGERDTCETSQQNKFGEPKASTRRLTRSSIKRLINCGRNWR
jgi:hypothetical protein